MQEEDISSEKSSECHFTLYLDESGDHLLYSEEEYVNNPKLETHCTLLGFVVPNNNKPVIKKALKDIKEHFWSTDEVVLHSVKIRHKQGPFAIFHYLPNMYEDFKIKIIEAIKIATPTIICSSLNKRVWIAKYPRKYFFKDDPYDQAFVFLLERYARFLNEQKGDNVVGKMSVEKRDPKKDKTLKDTYLFVKNNGTQYKNKDYFNRLADKMDFDDKDYNIPGLQLSDYCSYPFYTNHKHPEHDNELYELLKPHKYEHKKWPA